MIKSNAPARAVGNADRASPSVFNNRFEKYL